MMPDTGNGSPRRGCIVVVFYANPDRYPPTVNAINLLRRQYRIIIVCRNIGNADYPWPDDVTLHRCGPPGTNRDTSKQTALQKLAEYCAFVRTVRTVVRRDMPDLLYCYEPHAFSAVIVLAHAMKMPPCIYHRHEIEDEERLKHASLQTWIMRYAQRHLRSADCVVFPEKHRAAYYVRRQKAPPSTFIVPNYPAKAAFLLDHLFPDIIRKRWDDKTLLYRGGVSESILEALRGLSLCARDIRCEIIGAMPDAVQNAVRDVLQVHDLESRVTQHGYQSFARANELSLTASAGIVLYQRHERNVTYSATATNKLYEYAALGLPVIVPDTDAYRDHLRGQSWVVYATIEQPESIARALRTIFADHARYADMCTAARRVFAAGWNYDTAFLPVLRHIHQRVDPVTSVRRESP